MASSCISIHATQRYTDALRLEWRPTIHPRMAGGAARRDRGADRPPRGPAAEAGTALAPTSGGSPHHRLTTAEAACSQSSARRAPRSKLAEPGAPRCAQLRQRLLQQAACTSRECAGGRFASAARPKAAGRDRHSYQIRSRRCGARHGPPRSAGRWSSPCRKHAASCEGGKVGGVRDVAVPAAQQLRVVRVQERYARLSRGGKGKPSPIATSATGMLWTSRSLMAAIGRVRVLAVSSVSGRSICEWSNDGS